MITGVNLLHNCGGVDYDVQVEDLHGNSAFDVRVYVNGRIVFNKRHVYGSLVEGVADPSTAETMVREEMNKVLNLVRAAIDRGRIKA